LIKSAAAVLLLLVIVIVTVAGMLLAWNADLLRSSFIRYVSWQSGPSHRCARGIGVCTC